jgi:hypothetical protein
MIQNRELENTCPECDGPRGRYDEASKWNLCNQCLGEGVVTDDGKELLDFMSRRLRVAALRED